MSTVKLGSVSQALRARDAALAAANRPVDDRADWAGRQPLPLPSVSREHLFDFLGILYILAISPALFRGLWPRRRASAD